MGATRVGLLALFLISGCTTGPVEEEPPITQRLREDQTALLENGVVPIWVIFHDPTVSPGWLVARRFDATKRHGLLPAPVVIKAHTLDEIRQMLPQGLTRMARQPNDPVRLIETWY